MKFYATTGAASNSAGAAPNKYNNAVWFWRCVKRFYPRVIALIIFM